jgi:hypothetical protein
MDKRLNVGRGTSADTIDQYVNEIDLTFNSTDGGAGQIGVLPIGPYAIANGWDNVSDTSDNQRQIYLGFIDDTTDSTTGAVRVTIYYVQMTTGL